MSRPWTSTFKNSMNNSTKSLFSTPFNIEAEAFTPSKTFLKQEEEEDDDILNELNDQFISSHLLEEEEEPEEEEIKITASLPTTTSVWNETKQWPTTELKNIWDAGETKVSTAPNYSQFDNTEFDPTLQFYNGELYDADTIQDMNKLSLSVTNPSIEEVEKEDVEQDMSTLQMLQTLFSDLNESEIVEALEMHEYDADATIEYLLAKKSLIPPPAPAPPPPTVEDPVGKKRQACRHFLAGGCYRKDCWFSHDLQDKICKFWLQGTCFKGDSCEFSHTIDVQEVVANKMTTNTPQVVMEANIQSVNDYPALTPTNNRSAFTSTIAVQEEFPSLASAAAIKTPAIQSKQKVNFAEIAKKKKGDPTTPKAKKKTIVTAKRPYKYTFKELSEPVQIPWLETGSALNVTYMKEREKAIEYGMLRNRFFSKATEYYLKGDGARARMYSREAKQYNRLMQEMHKEASQRIFEQRSKHEAFIDLHGLHQDEAMEIIKERLDYMKTTYSGIIYIVTGTGHHSGANGISKRQSKLKPIVQQYLKQQNYRFAETNMLGDNQGGIFAVEI